MPSEKSPKSSSPESIGEIVLLRELAGEKMWAAALPLVRDKLKLTPDRLAAMIARRLSPERHVKQGEEALLRVLDEDTLREYKEEPQPIYPRHLTGISSLRIVKD